MKKLVLVFMIGLIIISCENNKEKYLPYYELIGKPISELSKIEKRTMKEDISSKKSYYINNSVNYVSYLAQNIDLSDTITYCEISLNKKSEEYTDIIKSINKEFKKKYKHQSYGNICDIYTTSNYKFACFHIKYIADKPNEESFCIYKIDNKKKELLKEHLESNKECHLADFVEEKNSLTVSFNEFALSILSLRYQGYSNKEIESMMETSN